MASLTIALYILNCFWNVEIAYSKSIPTYYTEKCYYFLSQNRGSNISPSLIRFGECRPELYMQLRCWFGMFQQPLQWSNACFNVVFFASFVFVYL